MEISESEESEVDEDKISHAEQKWRSRNAVQYSTTEDIYYKVNKYIFQKQIENKVTRKLLLCTACCKTIAYDKNEIYTHLVLGVLICKKCVEFYGSGNFRKKANGNDFYCRWCANGGELLLCDYCPYSFCKSCIKLNLGRSALKKAIDSTKWKCYSCSFEPLIDLRCHHRLLLENFWSVSSCRKMEKSLNKENSVKKIIQIRKLGVSEELKEEQDANQVKTKQDRDFEKDLKILLIIFNDHMKKIKKKTEGKKDEESNIKFHRNFLRLIDIMQLNFTNLRKEIAEIIGDIAKDTPNEIGKNNKTENSNEERILNVSSRLDNSGQNVSNEKVTGNKKSSSRNDKTLTKNEYTGKRSEVDDYFKEYASKASVCNSLISVDGHVTLNSSSPFICSEERFGDFSEQTCCSTQMSGRRTGQRFSEFSITETINGNEKLNEKVIKIGSKSTSDDSRIFKRLDDLNNFGEDDGKQESLGGNKRKIDWTDEKKEKNKSKNSEKRAMSKNKNVSDNKEEKIIRIGSIQSQNSSSKDKVKSSDSKCDHIPQVIKIDTEKLKTRTSERGKIDSNHKPQILSKLKELSNNTSLRMEESKKDNKMEKECKKYMSFSIKEEINEPPAVWKRKIIKESKKNNKMEKECKTYLSFSIKEEFNETPPVHQRKTNQGHLESLEIEDMEKYGWNLNVEVSKEKKESDEESLPDLRAFDDQKLGTMKNETKSIMFEGFEEINIKSEIGHNDNDKSITKTKYLLHDKSIGSTGTRLHEYDSKEKVNSYSKKKFEFLKTIKVDPETEDLNNFGENEDKLECWGRDKRKMMINEGKNKNKTNSEKIFMFKNKGVSNNKKENIRKRSIRLQNSSEKKVKSSDRKCDHNSQVIKIDTDSYESETRKTRRSKCRKIDSNHKPKLLSCKSKELESLEIENMKEDYWNLNVEVSKENKESDEESLPDLWAFDDQENDTQEYETKSIMFEDFEEIKIKSEIGHNNKDKSIAKTKYLLSDNTDESMGFTGTQLQESGSKEKVISSSKENFDSQTIKIDPEMDDLHNFSLDDDKQESWRKNKRKINEIDEKKTKDKSKNNEKRSMSKNSVSDTREEKIVESIRSQNSSSKDKVTSSDRKCDHNPQVMKIGNDSCESETLKTKRSKRRKMDSNHEPKFLCRKSKELSNSTSLRMKESKKDSKLQKECKKYLSFSIKEKKNEAPSVQQRKSTQGHAVISGIKTMKEDGWNPKVEVSKEKKESDEESLPDLCVCSDQENDTKENETKRKIMFEGFEEIKIKNEIGHNDNDKSIVKTKYLLQGNTAESVGSTSIQLQGSCSKEKVDSFNRKKFRYSQTNNVDTDTDDSESSIIHNLFQGYTIKVEFEI